MIPMGSAMSRQPLPYRSANAGALVGAGSVPDVIAYGRTDTEQLP